MPLLFSAGAVVFREENGDISYLLIKNSLGHWEFPKGVIGDEIKGEKAKDAVVRECKDETGIDDLIFVEGFRQSIHYFFKKGGETFSKRVTFFLAETKKKDIKLSPEHTEYAWLSYEEALDVITFDNSKGILEKADAFLKKSKK
ncbi:NUDIX domain-containing protein [Candidatus Woesearchaeota archaeon]|nr:NUDIX domain-containing protein [Candidatus Woesearchaeota archaeon]